MSEKSSTLAGASGSVPTDEVAGAPGIAPEAIDAALRLLPTVLHELRNPLASVMLSLEVLLPDLDPGPVRNELVSIVALTARMRSIMDGLELAGRPVVGRRRQPVNISMLEAYRTLEPRARDLGIRASLAAAPLPDLRFDPAVLRSIVFQIFSSSIRACRVDDEISVMFRMDGQMLEIVVEDTATDADPSTPVTCFDEMPERRSRWTGLGLYLCQRSAREAGGSLMVDAVPGHGTRTSVRLPDPDPADVDSTT